MSVRTINGGLRQRMADYALKSARHLSHRFEKPVRVCLLVGREQVFQVYGFVSAATCSGQIALWQMHRYRCTRCGALGIAHTPIEEGLARAMLAEVYCAAGPRRLTLDLHPDQCGHGSVSNSHLRKF